MTQEDIEVVGERKKWRRKRAWKKQAEDESSQFGLRRDDALCQSKWIVDVIRIVAALS